MFGMVLSLLGCQCGLDGAGGYLVGVLFSLPAFMMIYVGLSGLSAMEIALTPEPAFNLARHRVARVKPLVWILLLFPDLDLLPHDLTIQIGADLLKTGLWVAIVWPTCLLLDRIARRLPDRGLARQFSAALPIWVVGLILPTLVGILVVHWGAQSPPGSWGGYVSIYGRRLAQNSTSTNLLALAYGFLVVIMIWSFILGSLLRQGLAHASAEK